MKVAVPLYRIEERNGRVVLPGLGDLATCCDVSIWDDGNLVRFARALGVTNTYVEDLDDDGNPTRGVTSTAVLVCHEHNTYNRNAISVSTPKANGGSSERRHLGYLPESVLNLCGQDTLPALINHAGGEVDVTIIMPSADALYLDIPEPGVLGAAVRAFLEPHGIAVTGALARTVPIGPPERTHSGKHPSTVRTLRLLRASPAARDRPSALGIRTEHTDDPANRSLCLSNPATQSYLGSVSDGRLELRDERDRNDVRSLLTAVGVPTFAPVTHPNVREDGTWPVDLVPHAWTKTRLGGRLDLRAHDPDDSSSQKSFAIYNSSTKVLWVEDSHLVAPALRFVHRVGINPVKVGLPQRAWNLDSEVTHRAYRNSGEHFTGPAKPSLLASLKAVLPDGVLIDEVIWLSSPPHPRPPGPNFAVQERYVMQRADLFPQHTLTGTFAACRLCGHLGSTFTTPIASGELTYCHTCLSCAARGLVDDRSRSARATRALSDLEFDSQPILEADLTTLHVNPQDPATAETIDRLLALRFAVARRRIAWTLLLEAAGFAEDGMRLSRGTLIRARDGHLCLSMGERAVCDFLHKHGITHKREPLYPFDADYNPSGLRRADWLLTDGTYVELWGFPNDASYAAEMDAKRTLARRHGIQLIELYDTSLPNLPTVFGAWLPCDRVTGWAWSPLLVDTSERPRRAATAGTKESDGQNDFNSAARRERLARCAEAVRLQAQGSTRAEIGQLMGVGAETVKALLRDGKFYVDPSSDPPRLHRATLASEARRRGATRARFQSNHNLSRPKAEEAWVDAGVLTAAL